MFDPTVPLTSCPLTAENPIERIVHWPGAAGGARVTVVIEEDDWLFAYGRERNENNSAANNTPTTRIRRLN